MRTPVGEMGGELLGAADPALICLQRFAQIVIIITMHVSPLPSPDVPAPELARRFGLIMAGLAGLIAARMLRMPRYAGLIVTLWHRLQRAARRFERVVTRPVAVGRDARPAVVRAARVRKPEVRLPQGHGWLVRVLGWEAAAYMSQLETLLATPGMDALAAGRPGVGRVLRPVCRMLGVGARVVRKAKPRVKVAVVVPAMVDDGWRPKPTRATWWRPPKEKFG